MSDVGLDFPITADAKSAEAEVKRFRQFVNTQFSGVTADVKASTSSFNALRQSINQNAQVTRGALTQALVEGRKNIGGLLSEAKAAQKEFEKLEKAEEKAFKMASGSSGLFGSLTSGLTSGVTGIVGGVLGGNLLLGAVSKLASGLQSEVSTAFNFLDLQERSKIAFATIFRNAGLSGEEAATKATEHLKELFDFGAKTPFRTEQLIELSQRLQAVGFKAKEIIPTLTGVGDAVAGLGGDPEKLEQIIDALAKIKVTARVGGQEIESLSKAGVNVLKYLSDYSGKSVDEVRKLAEKNQLDSEVAVKVITGGMEKDFAGMMKATEGTYSSMWSTIEDLNQQRAAQAFKPTFDEVKKGQKAAIAGLESGAAEGFAEGAAGVQKVLLGGFDKILAGIASGDFKELGFNALDSVVTGAKDGAKGTLQRGHERGRTTREGLARPDATA
ncbi:MAG: hypothetical protein QOJ70_1137 [Acidobacteriota bacterium]|jgi:tape measure domain-containing protein|nr:hypothetical protein [Acidobacteriota bacterium]